MCKYQRSRIDSFFTIDKKVTLDPFKKVPKIEEFLDEWKLSMQQSNEKCRNVNINFEMRYDRRNAICHAFAKVYSFWENNIKISYSQCDRLLSWLLFEEELAGPFGRAVVTDQTLMKWPARSPDLTPLDFYFWGYTKGKVYKPPPQQKNKTKQNGWTKSQIIAAS